MPPRFAALDLGTNNCRLLIAERDPAPNPAGVPGQGFRVVDAFSRIVRLGEGLELDGCLSEAAIARTVAALRICAAKIRRSRVAAKRLVATEACRRAANIRDFVTEVAWEIGLHVEVISAEEEARLAVAGCRPLLDRGRPHALLFDIGGGSTEVIWLDLRGGGDPRVVDTLSLPVGVVTLSERYDAAGIGPRDYDVIIAEIRSELETFDRRNGIARRIAEEGVQMIGSSGTVTTLAGLNMGLARYDRAAVDGSYLSRVEAVTVSRGLLELELEARSRLPCIGRERADLVVGGCAILEAIVGLWPVDQLRVADRGVREGVLVELMSRTAVPDPAVVGA